MKLARYGKPGKEKPALVDAQGRLRDLSTHVTDIGGESLTPHGLAKLAAMNPTAFPSCRPESALTRALAQTAR